MAVASARLEVVSTLSQTYRRGSPTKSMAADDLVVFLCKIDLGTQVSNVIYLHTRRTTLTKASAPSKVKSPCEAADV